MADPETNEDAQPRKPPPKIPDHELLRRIGEGAYGEVWLARNSLGTFRAIKVIHCGRFKDNDRPYEREFTGLKNFEPISRGHEGLVDILQVGRNDDAGYFFYVMEAADDSADQKVGKRESETHPPAHSPTFSPASYRPLTLEDKIRANGRLPVTECIRIAATLADALRYLHKRELVHRDIKPSNIIFVDGVPKLADVGLVARTDSARTFVGTEGFLPPEGPGTPKADLYSLGKCLYEMAMGKDRQAFPSPPTRLDELPDRKELLELNEVINKACDPDPAERYQSAQAMLEELQLLQQGKSVSRARTHRKRLRMAAVVSAVTAFCVLIAGLFWFVNYQTKPRILFQDDFSGAQLDTNWWTRGHMEYRHEDRFGKPRFQVDQAGGELVLQAKAEHEDGWSVQQRVWVDLKRDLREWSPCRIEIEMAGKVAEGCLAVTVVEDTDAPPPPDNEVHGAVLARLDGIYDQTNAWPVVRMRIDLLANAQAAIVYRDTNRLDEFDVVDLREFGRWGLRLFAFARTSRGLPSGEADFRIKEAVIFTRPGAEPVVGRIVETPSEVPVADAVVKNPRGRTLAKTRENGAFAVRVGKRDSPLAVEKPNYFVEAPLANPVEPFSTVRLRNLNPGPGAMIEAIPYGNLFVANIGFRGDALMVLVHDSDTNCSLRPLDLITRTVAPDLANFLELETGKDGLLSGFAECGDRLIGIKHWQGAVFDLTSGSPQWLTAITNHDGSPLSYPQGCTFDGEYLWFVENDVTNQRFGLCAFDLGRMSLWRRFTSLDRSISGLAWDSGRKQFWVSNTKGRVYGVSRQNLLRLGTVEMAQEGGSFAGSYTRLAWGLGYLWGLDQQNRRICKIKITD